MNGYQMRLFVVFAGLLAPTLMLADPSACDSMGAANLVQNCGFETGDFTSWTETGNVDTYTQVVPDWYGTGVHSGDYFAALGAMGSDDILYQDLNTVAGQNYVFKFYLASDGSTPNDFTAKWDGNIVFSQSDIDYGPYTVESFWLTATSTTTRIEFDSRNDPGHLGLDDVAVFVPEPSLPFMGSLVFGVLLLGMFKLHKVTQ